MELDKEATKEEQPVAPQSTVTSDNDTIMWLAIGGLVIALAGFGGWVILRKQQRALAALSSQEANQTQQLDAKVKELEFTNKQLKRQLEKVFKEFKRLAANPTIIKLRLPARCLVTHHKPFLIAKQ